MTFKEFQTFCFTHNRDFICYHEANGKLIYVSENAESITGYKPEEFDGQSPYDYFHPDDQEYVNHYGHLPALEEGGKQTVIYRFQKKSGEYIWFKTEIFPMKNDAGTITHLLTRSCDYTAYIKLQEDLERKEKVFDEAGNLAKIGAWETDLETQQVTWSKMIYDIHEIDYDFQPDFESVMDLFDEKYRPVVKNAREKAINQGIPFNLVCKAKTGSGNRIWVRVIGKPQLYLGKVYKLFGVTQEVNEQIENQLRQKMLVDQLTNQKHQLEEFNYIFSHNLRSPVANLPILCDMVEQAGDEQEQKDFIDKIRKTSENLNEILEDLVNSVKMINSREIEQEELVLSHILRKSINQLEGDINQSGAKITSDFQEWEKIEYPRMYMDSIFLNLISNALKYASPERTPEIKITTLFENDRKVLKFTDNGLGIDLEKHGDKIFKMNKTFHNHQQGKGLGLFITKNQIEAMGGEINVESKVNEGATFTIRFNQ